MKKLPLLFVLSCLAIHSSAQLTAYFSHCLFNTPDHKPYVETYLSVSGSSVVFRKNSNGKYQGIVEVGILFSKNSRIAASDKYNLMSPEAQDTLARPNFIDLHRFALDTGEYDLELSIRDKNNANAKTFSISEKITIRSHPGRVNVSDIELLSSYSKAETKGLLTKNGFNMVPYSSNFFPEEVKELALYAEIYDTRQVLGENEKFLVSWYVRKYEDKVGLPALTAFRQETAGSIIPLLSKFNISDLPSGNYELVVEVRNSKNDWVAGNEIFFQRKNQKVQPVADLSHIMVESTFASAITGRDTLTGYIRSLRPIASAGEKDFINHQVKSADMKLLQQFFYNFWLTRKPAAPEAAWNSYRQDVNSVNAKFSSFIMKGYDTDRGRVYLQYGPPDKREEYPREPNAYPYEIWIYYTLEDRSKFNPRQTNRQFIFYNPALVTDDYQLLNSDALGEIHDQQWEMKLYKRMNQSNDFDYSTAPEHYGGNAHDESVNPK